MDGVQASLHYLTPLQKTEKSLSILTLNKHHMPLLFPSFSVFINLVSNHQCPRMEIISQINSEGQLHSFNIKKILLTFDVNSPSILCRLFSSVVPICVLYTRLQSGCQTWVTPCVILMRLSMLAYADFCRLADFRLIKWCSRILKRHRPSAFCMRSIQPDKKGFHGQGEYYHLAFYIV